MIEVVPATPAHARAMAPLMSDKDRAEAVALGMTPEAALLHSLEGSLVADCAIINGTPAAMWGLCPKSLIGERALMWMLGTPAVQRNAKALLVMSRYFTEWAQERYSVLEALIDSRHDQALRWVLWLGFQPTGSKVLLQGVPFVVFERTKRHGA